MTATETEVYFVPQIWVHDYAMEVDPQGPTHWHIRPDEIDLSQDENDYLRYSDTAPKWVQEWAGPFEIYAVDVLAVTTRQPPTD